MASVIGGLIRRASRSQGEVLNILTHPTHESFESGLCQTAHNFYAFQGEGIKTWDKTYRPLPDNYHLLNPALGYDQIPHDVEFDVVLIQTRYRQYEVLRPVAERLHIPIVGLEHTGPSPDWSKDYLMQIKERKSHINIFISEWSRKAWGWSGEEGEVIHHGIDSERFSPLRCPKKPHILSVVNQFRERDAPCGYSLWERLTGGLPRLHIGSSPDGWSEPAQSVAELIQAYRECGVFINTSLVSPIPTALLEAMACGCVVISTATCMCPEVVKDGENGFISNNERYLRMRLEEVLAHPEKYAHLGRAARQTVLEKFSMGKFVERWDEVLRKAASIIPFSRGTYF